MVTKLSRCIGGVDDLGRVVSFSDYVESMPSLTALSPQIRDAARYLSIRSDEFREQYHSFPELNGEPLRNEDIEVLVAFFKKIDLHLAVLVDEKGRNIFRVCERPILYSQPEEHSLTIESESDSTPVDVERKSVNDEVRRVEVDVKEEVVEVEDMESEPEAVEVEEPVGPLLQKVETVTNVTNGNIETYELAHFLAREGDKNGTAYFSLDSIFVRVRGCLPERMVPPIKKLRMFLMKLGLELQESKDNFGKPVFRLRERKVVPVVPVKIETPEPMTKPKVEAPKARQSTPRLSHEELEDRRLSEYEVEFEEDYATITEFLDYESYDPSGRPVYRIKKSVKDPQFAGLNGDDLVIIGIDHPAYFALLKSYRSVFKPGDVFVQDANKGPRALPAILPGKILSLKSHENAVGETFSGAKKIRRGTLEHVARNIAQAIDFSPSVPENFKNSLHNRRTLGNAPFVWVRRSPECDKVFEVLSNYKEFDSRFAPCEKAIEAIIRLTSHSHKRLSVQLRTIEERTELPKRFWQELGSFVVAAEEDAERSENYFDIE